MSFQTVVDEWEWKGRVKRYLQVWELVNKPALGEIVEIPEERIAALWDGPVTGWILLSRAEQV